MNRRPAINDVLVYAAFGGEHREVTITDVHDDVKNGRPGFDATASDGMDVWGYDDQIICWKTA